MSAARNWLEDAELVAARARHATPKPLQIGKTKPYRGCVSFRPRPDLDPTSDSFALPKEYRLTSAAEMVGVVEVMDAGPPPFDKDGRAARLPWQTGDIALVSFADVRQAFMLEGEQCYITNSDSLFARLHADGSIAPSLDWVITKTSPLRMTQAVQGHVRTVLTPAFLSGGVPSGEIQHTRCGTCGTLHAFPTDKPSKPVTRVLYEEIVSVGPGRFERGTLRAPDQAIGELALFSVDFSIPFAVKGEPHHAVPAPFIMCTVD